MENKALRVRLVKPVFRGWKLHVYDPAGRMVRKYDALKLTKEWLATEDHMAFFEKYRFVWVPPMWMRGRVGRNENLAG